MKKFILVFLGIIIVVAIGLGVWMLINKSPLTNNNGEPFSGESGFGSFFDTKNGRNNNFTGGPFDDLEESDFVATTKLPILRQLSAEPVAGYVFFKKEFEILNSNIGEEETVTEETIKEGRFVFRFIERATGHIFETAEHFLTTTKITNTTSPKIVSALFSDDGNFVFFEKLNITGEGIDSFIGEVVEQEIPQTNEDEQTSTINKSYSLEIEPYSILSNLTVPSPNKNSFAYLVSSNESSSIFIDSFENKNKVEIFNTPIKEWLIDWTTQDTINMTTKPSSESVGHSYSLNTRTGSLNKLIGNINGLTTKISPNEEGLLYSETSGNSIITRFKSLESGEDRRIPLSVLPEKCVFSNTQDDVIYCGTQSNSVNTKLPDDWYKGKVSFNDSIWKINTTTGLVEMFYNFNRNKFGSFDLIDLSLTEGDEFMLFKNKKDLTLWSLNLKELDNRNVFTTDSPEDF